MTQTLPESATQTTLDTSDRIKAYLKSHSPDHLRRLYHVGMETQILLPDNKRVRIPWDGRGERGEPDYDFHHAGHIDLTGACVGTSGWNWTEQHSEWIGFDFDALTNHTSGLSKADLDELITRLGRVPEMELIRSKSGHGIHGRLYFERPPNAALRQDHLHNARLALAWLTEQVGIDIPDAVDCYGVMLWIAAPVIGENGFQVIKPKHRDLPPGWSDGINIDTPTPPKPQSTSVEPAHRLVIDYMAKHFGAQWQDDKRRLVTHTFYIAQAFDRLGFRGEFHTLSEGVGDGKPNCWMAPDRGGAWAVIRYGQGVIEHGSWQVTKNGYTMCRINQPAKADMPTSKRLYEIGIEDELFIDGDRNVYANVSVRGCRETLQITEGRYRYHLIRKFIAETGQLPEAKYFRTAIDGIQSHAEVSAPLRQVAIRTCYDEQANTIYVDLCNQKGEVAEVTDKGWSVITDCPVAFRRPPGMLCLPTPAPGTYDDLEPFLTCYPADRELLLAWMVGVYQPIGSLSQALLMGEQGSGKTSKLRLMHELLDPHMAVGLDLQTDNKGLLVAASLRRIVSYDNVSNISRQQADLLCCLSTGAARVDRKLYTDGDSATLRTKNPIILTSIKDVVTEHDHSARVLRFLLPPIANRKTEASIAAALTHDNTRGKILGYILDGVVSALARFRTIKADLPRLADFAAWATAAEPGLGLPDGSVIAAIQRQIAENASSQVDDGGEFLRRLRDQCEKGFDGSAQKLAKEISLGLTSTQCTDLLREHAPSLRQLGYMIVYSEPDRKAKRGWQITLGKAA